MSGQPNEKLKLYLFKNRMTQRDLSFGTQIAECKISRVIKYGGATPEVKERISKFLQVGESEIFPS